MMPEWSLGKEQELIHYILASMCSLSSFDKWDKQSIELLSHLPKDIYSEQQRDLGTLNRMSRQL